jgi:dolichyl-phosphate beta-glucosyltransferase
MSTSPYLSVIVPAYNEVHIIGATLSAMQAYLDQQNYRYEILVSADGNDGTRDLASKLAACDPRISVLGSAERGGKGKGIRRAVARARGQIIGFVDADYKTPIEELDKLLPWFDEDFDLVLGSRNVDSSVIETYQPFYRRVGSRCFHVAMHLLVGLWDIRDTQCGFKFFRRQAARDLFSRLRVNGYMFDVDLLYMARRSGYRTKEIGVRWRDDGDSRLALVSGNWQNMKDLFRIRFSPIPPPVVEPAAMEQPVEQTLAA